MLRIVLALLLIAPAASAAPAPITAHEKFACEVVADYLSRGPRAVAERLSTNSPFRRLDPADVEPEIEARLGPPAGSWWELRTITDPDRALKAAFHVVYPSGAEDVVTLVLDREGEQYKLNNLITLAEIEGLADRRRYNVMTTRASALAATGPMKWLLLIGPALFILGLSLRRTIPRGARLILFVSFGLFVVPFAAWVNPPWLRQILHRDVLNSPDIIPMRELVPVRRAMAAGEAIRYSVPENPDTSDIAKLWNASVSPAAEVEKQLKSLQNLTGSPMATLIRSRMAAAAGSYDNAAEGYRAIRGASHDTFWPEEALTVALNDDRHNERTSPLYMRNGRDAALLYAASLQAASRNDMKVARIAFREAWQLKPMSRAKVLSTSIYLPLLRDPMMAGIVDFRTPLEKAPADSALATQPLKVPESTTAIATGSFVRLAIGDARFDIPGGGAIAPAGTTALAPAGFDRAEAEDALRRAEHLKAPALSSGSTQRTIHAAANALAERNRWDRILELTEAITPDSANIPLALVTWRIEALVRTKKFDDAKTLAASRTMQRAIKRDADGEELIRTSYLFAKAGAWNEAIRMLSEASAIEGTPDVTLLYQRFGLRRTLAESKPVSTTRHFDIHVSPDVGAAVASRVGDLLEAELARLEPRFGVTEFHRVRVNVLPWHLFAGLTGSFHILGFYDGEITIPFGEVASFREDVVSTLTHELTHALIDQVSEGATPRWLHEGIASRMELVERQDNVFQARPPGQIMALELLDPFILSGFDPQEIGEGYLTAQTFVRFLEDRFGERSINDLLDAYRDGNDTHAALLSVTQMPIADLDREFRTWGLTNAGPFVDRRPWPYDRFHSVGIDPQVLEGIRWSKPKK